MAFSHRHAGALSFLLLSIARTITATNPCFFPNGQRASNFVPCSPNGDGDCCAVGDSCTSLGYCLSESDGDHYRGACTDSAWGNPSCPDYCLADINSGNTTFVNVIPCDGATTSSGPWCCAYDGDCCSSSTFTPYFGTVFAEPSWSTSTTPAASTTSPAVSTSTSNTENTSTPSAAENTSTSGSAGGSPASNTSVSTSTLSTASSIAVGSIPSTSPTSTQTSETPTSKSKSISTGAIAGIVVAAVLGLAAIVAFTFFLLERKKRLRIENEKTEMQQGSSYANTGKDLDKPPSATLYGHQSDMLNREERHELPTEGTPEMPTWNGIVPAAEMGDAT